MNKLFINHIYFKQVCKKCKPVLFYANADVAGVTGKFKKVKSSIFSVDNYIAIVCGHFYLYSTFKLQVTIS